MTRPPSCRTHLQLLALAVLLAPAVGCGGGSGGSPEGDDTSSPASSAPEPSPPARVTPDTGNGLGAAPGDAGPGDAEREAAAPGEASLPGWTAGSEREPGRGGGVAEIRSLRTGSHAEFDRVVIEFSRGDLPGYSAGYVDRPLHECGSGREVHPVGDGWLQLRLEPARGHTEEGRATLPRDPAVEGLPVIRRIYRTCDFEGVVTLVLAVDSPNRFRVFTLQDPARVVVDVRKQRGG